MPELADITPEPEETDLPEVVAHSSEAAEELPCGCNGINFED